MNTSTLNPTIPTAFFTRPQTARPPAITGVARPVPAHSGFRAVARVFRQVSDFMGNSTAAWASAGAIQNLHGDGATSD